MSAELVTVTYAVTGLTCQNCVNHVTEEVTEIDGVQDVAVELNVGGASTVTVQSAAPLALADVAAAIEEAGYVLQS